MEIERGVQFPTDIVGARSSPPACSATSTSASSRAPTRRPCAAGDTITQTQSAVVLENLISQFLFNKAADAGSGSPRRRRRASGGEEMKRSRRRRAVVARAAAGRLALRSPAATTRAARRRPGPAARPVGELEPQGLRFNEALDEHVLKPVATAYRDVVPQLVRTRRQQLLRQLRRRLVGRQQLSCRASSRTASHDAMRVRHQHRCSASAACSTSPREMGLEHHYEDFGQTLGHWGVGAGAYLVLPLLGPVDGARRRSRCRWTGSASPALVFDDGAGAGRTHAAADRQHARRPARREPRASTTSRSTSTPSCATPTCSGGAAWSTTASRRTKPDEPATARRQLEPPRRRRRRPRRRLPQCVGTGDRQPRRIGTGSAECRVEGRAEPRRPASSNARCPHGHATKGIECCHDRIAALAVRRRVAFAAPSAAQAQARRRPTR